MRRWPMAVVLTGLSLAGCKGLKEMFSARPEVVAEAKGQELKVERLATLMTTLKGIPETRQAAEFLANIWVDYTLVSQAIAAGRDLGDSATATEAMWPELAEARGSRWHEVLLAHRVPLDSAVADSVYNADHVRIFQHVLFRVEPNAEPPARTAARRKAEQVLAKIKAGGNFAQLAKQNSDDPGSKGQGGYLPASPRGKWVTAFDSAGWALAPGAMTGIVESPFGYHIIRRPPAAEVRDRLLSYTRDLFSQKLDSVYLDSLGIRKHLKVAGDAPASIRKALADRDNSPKSAERLASYDGGDVTVAYFMRWVSALGPAWASDLVGRPDSTVKQFVRLIGQNKLLLQQADSAGVGVTPDEWASLLQRYRNELDTLRMSLGIAGNDLSDPATPPAERARVAAMKLDAFWDQLAVKRSRPRPIPGQLAAFLRREGGFRVEQGALDRTVELAREYKMKADSAAQAPKPVPPGTPQPGAAPTAPAPGGK
ncbi:MAG TPA: peptidylprolyl isomerase [Gemmatimonadales bacterium]|nr:peptidylprolyl isomerase [Gemmatimonadales bacterium]